MRIYSLFTNEKNVTEKSVLFSVTVVSYELSLCQLNVFQPCRMRVCTLAAYTCLTLAVNTVYTAVDN